VNCNRSLSVLEIQICFGIGNEAYITQNHVIWNVKYFHQMDARNSVEKKINY